MISYCRPDGKDEYDPDTDPNYEEPVFTIAEIELFLANWQRYVDVRPNSKIGPLNVAYWERKLAEARRAIN